MHRGYWDYVGGIIGAKCPLSHFDTLDLEKLCFWEVIPHGDGEGEWKTNIITDFGVKLFDGWRVVEIGLKIKVFVCFMILKSPKREKPFF